MTKGAQPTLCTRVEKRSTLRMPVPPRQPSSTKQASAGAWYIGVIPTVVSYETCIAIMWCTTRCIGSHGAPPRRSPES